MTKEELQVYIRRNARQGICDSVLFPLNIFILAATLLLLASIMSHLYTHVGSHKSKIQRSSKFESNLLKPFACSSERTEGHSS